MHGICECAKLVAKVYISQYAGSVIFLIALCMKLGRYLQLCYPMKLTVQSSRKLLNHNQLISAYHGC